MKKIKIKGAIVDNSDGWVYDWFGMDYTTPENVEVALNDASNFDINFDIDVEINSGGGSVHAGSEIYTMLMNYQGVVNVKIVGIAASAASVIAMAGNKISMSPTATLMIHNVYTVIAGDSTALEKETEVLKGYNEGIANSYLLKTGKSKEELLNLMEKETYFNAREAKEAGFIDEIMFDTENKIAASVKSNMIPEEIMNKMRNQLSKDNELKNIEQNKAKLNLLKLMEVRQ